MNGLIVVPDSGWILSKIGERIAAAGQWQCMRQSLFLAMAQQRVSLARHKDALDAGDNADFIFYCDMQNCWHLDYKRVYPNTKHIGFFTHLDQDSPDSFRNHWYDLDGVVHMCERYKKAFTQCGFYPAEKQIVIPPYEVGWQFSPKKVRVGVVQRGGYLGKGDGFLQSLLQILPTPSFYKFIIKGTGWREDSFGEGVSFDHNEDYNTYPEFYRSLDVLFIPSLWEGGPMCLPEALAMGLSVVSADVGWVPDFAQQEGVDITMFPPGDINAAKDRLMPFLTKRWNQRNKITANGGGIWNAQPVHNWGYTHYCKRLVQFIENLP